ncbi:MAG: hypothetical protein GX638_06880 [Crenarchaeota archaeon]|nr:hypothetical protein [Thermoproteota archaeon]
MIDEGIDTGNIIAARRIKNPFQTSDSLDDLKGRSHMVTFELLTDTAMNELEYPDYEVVGTPVAKELRGPNYLGKNFTPDVAALAVSRFQEMKKAEK